MIKNNTIMKTLSRQPDPVSHMIQGKNRAPKQANVESILQKYAAKTIQLQVDNELQGVNDNVGLEEDPVQMMVSGGVVQRLKWIRDDNKYKVFDAIGSYRTANTEEMENFPGTDVWRPETVWDDDEKKWYEISGSELVERVEDIRITPFMYQPYCENSGDKIIFGHKIGFTTWFKGQEIKWEEKTNEPYDLVYAIMEKDAWIDLYSILKGSSNVFAGARDINNKKYKGYAFSDPPGIFKEPNRNRILEFKISFKDVSGNVKTIQATQVLRTDEKGDITEQSFNYRIE